MATSLETKQVTLQLTNNKELLKQLKKNKALKTDEKGDVYTMSFNAQQIEFRPGVPVTLGETVAKALIRDSRTILGDHLTGEYLPVVMEISHSNLGEVSPQAKKAITACPICGVDKQTLDKLAKHILSAHRRDSANLYSKEESTDPTDWEAEIENAKSE